MLLSKLFKKNEVIDYDFCVNLEPKQYPKYLMEIFKQKMGYTFNLKKPKTLNEIIQHLKIYDNIPIKSILTDKTQSCAYVDTLLNNKKIIKEIYGIYDSINDIQFNTLPDKFIIKTNNSCWTNTPVLNKAQLTEELKTYIINFYINKKKENYAFVNGFELQYEKIPYKIIVERLYPKIEEYQVLCTDGKPILIVHTNQKEKIYNEVLHLDEKENIIEEIEIKNKIKEIIEYARVLSRNFILVRIDFMLVNKLYWFFQEFTFTPYSGYAPYIPEYNDEKYALPVLKNMKK